jgi:hypothetical protein
MPYPVYPVQNQTAQQLANIGSNLGVAMFGDANSMMRRSQLDQDLKFKQLQLDLKRQELGMHGKVWDSEVAKNEAQTGGFASKNQGASDLADVISNSAIVNQDGTVTIDPNKMGFMAGAAMRANPNGNVAQVLQGLVGLSIQQRPGATEDQYRQAAAIQGKMPSENTAFTTGQATSLQKPIQISGSTTGIIAPPNSPYNQGIQELGSQMDARNQAQTNPPALLPNGGGNPVYTPNGAPMPAASPMPTGSPTPALNPNGLTSANPAQSGAAPVSVANAFPASRTGASVSLPGKGGSAASWGTASSSAKDAKEYSGNSDRESDVAAKAQSLLDTGAYKLAHVPGGGIPAVEGLSKFLVSQTDTKKRDALMQLQSLMTSDWLDKSTIMKGALTEAEGAELRKDQPHFGDDPEVIKSWLQRVAYLHDMHSAINNANFDRTVKRQPPVNPMQFKQAYVQAHHPPSNMIIHFGDSGSGLANTVSGSGGPAVGTVEDGHVFVGGDPSNPASWRPVQ